jgi:hypothetical protein
MKPVLRPLVLLSGASLLLGGDCMFGRPIVDERGRYYPTDGVISCVGTRCADLPAYELELPPPLDDSPCSHDLPSADLEGAVGGEASLVGVRYELASERMREVQLGSLELHDSCVVLSGPVRVAFGDGSKLTNVTFLLGPAHPAKRSKDGRQSAQPTPNVYLAHAELDRVVLQAAEQDAASGSAQVEYSTCNQCETSIDSLSVTESQMQRSRLGAGSLTMVGGAFDSVELAFGYGLLAGVLANNLRTTACNTLSLVGATIAGRASKIGPCDCMQPAEPSDAATFDADLDASPLDAGASDAGEPDAGTLDADASDAGEPDTGPLDAGATDAGAMDGGGSEAGATDADGVESGEPDASEEDAARASSACNGATFSQTTFVGGMVDGKVHAENSSFRSVLFARHAPTALDLWNTSIELSALCDQQVDVRLDKTSAIGCTSCDSPEHAAACRLDQAPQLTVNQCKSFQGQLPECEPPLPTPRLPHLPMPPRLGQAAADDMHTAPATP